MKIKIYLTGFLSDLWRLQIVLSPIRPRNDFSYSKDRRFPISVLNKTLKKGEIAEHTWLIYSVCNDVVYGFIVKYIVSLTKFACYDWKHFNNIYYKRTWNNHIVIITLSLFKNNNVIVSIKLNTNKTIDSAH